MRVTPYYAEGWSTEALAAFSVAENRWQLLDRNEGKWRPLLRRVSLVAEADIDPEESRPVLAALGHVYGKYRGHRAADKLLAFRHWPCCLAVSMTGIAATGYEEGRYWPELWRAAEYQGSAQDQHVWGASFLSALAQLGLPAFPGARQPYLGPILMHCGIPTYCLGDLLRSLADHSRRDPGMDADSFMSWVTCLSSRMNGLDKPVQNLLRDGREYAYDIIDRLIDLLDRLRDPEPDLFGVGLPNRLVNATLSVTAQRHITLPPTARRDTRCKMGGKLRLALDPFGSGPLVMLPVCDGTWRVTVDGVTHDVPASLEQEGDYADIPFALPRPTRHVQVSLIGTAEEPVTFTIVKDEDPLLVFSEDGEFLPASQPLPPDPVWLLFRQDRDLVYGSEAPVICTAHVPFGWDGWALREVDLSDIRELGLSQNCVRTVRGSGHPRLLLPEPLLGVTDPHHRPVYGSPPRISLPGGDSERMWSIELRKITASPAPPVRVTAYSGDIDPWSRQADPVVGTFEITILGSLGFRFYRRICIAQDLTVKYEPPVRLISLDGLDEGEAWIAGPAALSHDQLIFGKDRQESAITYGHEKLLVTPPHLTILHDDGTDRARWSSKPLQISTESFIAGDPGVLLVRAPATLRIPPLRVVSHEVTQDVYPSGADPDGHTRYQLVQIKDTVAHAGCADLGLPIGDRIVPLASVRPPIFATGAELHGAQLLLTGYNHTPGLHIGIYQIYAPWRGATILPLSSGGIAVLPPPIRQAGPVRVFPATLDARSSWPPWPSCDESFLVPVRGKASGEDPAELALSAFLAGEGPCPHEVKLEWLWVISTLAERLQVDGTREDLSGQCSMCLRSAPASSLIALTRTRLEPSEAVTALIGSGLTALRLEADLDLDVVSQLWTRLPVAAVLLAGSALSDPERMPDLIELVAAEHGQQAAAILLGNTDPVLDALEMGERRSLAPDALIDVSRVTAELERSVSRRMADAPQLVTDAEELLARTPYGALARRISARPRGAPTMSAALALPARAAGSDPVRRREFQRKYQTFWFELASSFPDLVSLDIIAAQAAVAAIDRDRNL